MLHGKPHTAHKVLDLIKEYSKHRTRSAATALPLSSIALCARVAMAWQRCGNAAVVVWHFVLSMFFTLFFLVLTLTHVYRQRQTWFKNSSDKLAVFLTHPFVCKRAKIYRTPYIFKGLHWLQIFSHARLQWNITILEKITSKSLCSHRSLKQTRRSSRFLAALFPNSSAVFLLHAITDAHYWLKSSEESKTALSLSLSLWEHKTISAYKYQYNRLRAFSLVILLVALSTWVRL